jgi:hypothetical protein
MPPFASSLPMTARRPVIDVILESAAVVIKAEALSRKVAVSAWGEKRISSLSRPAS